MNDTRLWAVNIQGPDDLIAASSYEEATEIAIAWNRWWADHIKRRGGIRKNDPLMWAVPCEWPHPEGHAEDLANPSQDYAPIIQYARRRSQEGKNDG